MNIYALKDKACGIIHTFIANNDIAAKRSMAEFMERNKEDLLYKYAEDFDLLKLAEMDSDTGNITENKNEFICNMSNLKRSEK